MNEDYSRGVKLDYASVLEELTVLVRDQKAGLDSPYSIVCQFLTLIIGKSQTAVVSKEKINSEVSKRPQSPIVFNMQELKEADNLLLSLIEQTKNGFETGVKEDFMNGVQEMLKILKDKSSCFNNPHQIVCKLLELLVSDSVVGLESYVKAMVAEVAAKVVAKLLANNREKQIVISQE